MQQLLLHLIGDYFLQSDYFALNKNKNSLICAGHCLLYTLPFLLLTQSILALFLIFGTHFIIDRFSLAKYLIYVKNHLNSDFTYARWELCKNTGYRDIEDGKNYIYQKHPSRPIWMTVLLYIITDNSLHLICNFLILKYV